MAEAVFDKDGTITNLQDLSVEEVAEAYKAKNKEVFDVSLTEREKAKALKIEADQAKKDLEDERKKNVPVVEQKLPETNIGELRVLVGLTDEAIKELKVIAKGKDLSLMDAVNDPLFQLYQESVKEIKRKEDAKLPASSGSNQYVPPKGIKSGQKKEDHENAWREANGMEPKA